MNDAVRYLAAIPSPTQGTWYIAGFPVRAYALCIIAGIVAAVLIAEVRMRRRGAPHWLTLDIAVFAVPAGIIGGRIYHVITSPDAYFGTNGNPVKAFYIWEGGLGIWGAIAFGALGAWYACRRAGIPLTLFADALAPGLPVAQAIGRVGNWFNNELFGGHTDLPWGLNVWEYNLNAGQAVTDAAGNPIPYYNEATKESGPFHPTFLYEGIWNLGVALMVWLVDRKFKLGKGRAFALYVMGYTLGRFWIEAMRTDEAHVIAGMRVNNWVSILVFLGALIYFLRVKGPQEHIKIQEDGSLLVVTAEGEPIEWRKPQPAKASRDSDDGDDDDGDGGGGGDDGDGDGDDSGGPRGSGFDLGSHGTSRAKN